MRLSFPLLHFASFVIVIAAAIATLASATRTVEFVQLLHRHGARSPMPTSTSITPEYETFLCGGVGLCGQLNIQGKMMLQSLGNFLRQRYVDDAVLTDVPSPVRNSPSTYLRQRLQSQLYDTLHVHSQSTDIDRTLQSSGAMLQGLFGNVSNQRSMPQVIHTVSTQGPFATLLQPDRAVALSFPLAQNMWPPFRDWDFGASGGFANLLDNDDLLALAAETKMEKYCAASHLPKDSLNPSSWSYSEKMYYLDCALRLEDLAASFEAAGILGSFPKLRAAKPALDPMRREYWIRRFRFLPDSNEIQRNAGQSMVPWGDTLFFPWAEQKISEIQKLGRVNLEVLREYSAHVTTIAPLWSFFLHDEDAFMQPLFGEVAIIEFIGDTVANDIFIQLWSGRPASMTPPPNNSTDPAVFYAHYNYSRTMKPVSVPCMSTTDSSPRMVTDASCKYSDFKRAIQTKAAPQSPQGLCFIQSTLRTYIGCDTLDAPSADGACASYRQLCPKWGCPSGYVVNPADLSCVSLSNSASTTFIATTTTATSSTSSPSLASAVNDDDDQQVSKSFVVQLTVGVGAGCLLLGFVLGAIVTAAIARRRARTSTAEAGGGRTISVDYTALEAEAMQ